MLFIYILLLISETNGKFTVETLHLASTDQYNIQQSLETKHVQSHFSQTIKAFHNFYRPSNDYDHLNRSPTNASSHSVARADAFPRLHKFPARNYTRKYRPGRTHAIGRWQTGPRGSPRSHVLLTHNLTRKTTRARGGAQRYIPAAEFQPLKSRLPAAHTRRRAITRGSPRQGGRARISLTKTQGAGGAHESDAHQAPARKPRAA